jgi:hypothetical protein
MHVVAALMRQALAGDVTAARVLLDRAIAPLKPINVPVEIDVSGATVTERAGRIMDAVSRGELAILDAKALLDSLLQLARIEAMANGNALSDDLFKELDEINLPDEPTHGEADE